MKDHFNEVSFRGRAGRPRREEPSGYDKAWIEAVVVDESCRGRGIGRQLVLAALALARKKKIKAVNLTSRSDREPANLLYQKVGFKRVNTNCYRYTF